MVMSTQVSTKTIVVKPQKKFPLRTRTMIKDKTIKKKKKKLENLKNTKSLW